LGFVVREVQPTPNPNALKFVLDREIADRPTSFLTPDSAVSNPLAVRLFGVPGVVSLLFLGDFVTINKSSDARWADIRKAVAEILAED
jgi:hypothetical protein